MGLLVAPEVCAPLWHNTRDTFQVLTLPFPVLKRITLFANSCSRKLESEVYILE